MKPMGVVMAPGNTVKFSGMNLAQQSLLLREPVSRFEITRTVSTFRTIQ